MDVFGEQQIVQFNRISHHSLVSERSLVMEVLNAVLHMECVSRL
jgi:hypothetical protein